MKKTNTPAPDDEVKVDPVVDEAPAEPVEAEANTEAAEVVAEGAEEAAEEGSAQPKKQKVRKGNTSIRRRSMRKWSWLFIGPVFVSFIIGFLWPFGQGFYLSFNNFKVVSRPKYVGLQNYEKAFSDETFLHSFWFTALFAITSVILINVLAFAIAYALTQGVKGSNLFRTVFFMPNLIGGIVLGYLWSMIFDGILSVYQTSILAKAEYGFWGLIILLLWQQVGYMMIIYIAGLQSIPEDYLEAAKIDGATKSQTLFKIVIPNVMPSITICTFLTLTNSFKLYDQNLALTHGEPFRQTEMLALNISNGFSAMNTRGMAQAKAVVFFFLVAVLGIAQLVSTRKKEVQQ